MPELVIKRSSGADTLFMGQGMASQWLRFIELSCLLLVTASIVDIHMQRFDIVMVLCAASVLLLTFGLSVRPVRSPYHRLIRMDQVREISSASDLG